MNQWVKIIVLRCGTLLAPLVVIGKPKKGLKLNITGACKKHSRSFSHSLLMEFLAFLTKLLEKEVST